VKKNIVLIYVIYVPDTKDDNVIELVHKAVEENNGEVNNISNQTIHRKTFGKRIKMTEEQERINIITLCQ
jgi:hypothetical protein